MITSLPKKPYKILSLKPNSNRLTVSKPIGSTLLSFVLFLVICYVLIGMSILQLVQDQEPAWYVYLVIIALTPMALFITFRVFINYKVVELGNDQIVVKYTVRRKHKQYRLNQVIQWRELIVKTGKSSSFKELEILFDDKFKLTVGLREYTNYPKVCTYLAKKLPGKKQEG